MDGDPAHEWITLFLVSLSISDHNPNHSMTKLISKYLRLRKGYGIGQEDSK